MNHFVGVTFFHSNAVVCVSVGLCVRVMYPVDAGMTLKGWLLFDIWASLWLRL